MQNNKEVGNKYMFNTLSVGIESVNENLDLPTVNEI